MLAALDRNLDLQSDRVAARSVEAEVQNQRSIFDPTIAVTPTYTLGGSNIFSAGIVTTERATQGDVSASVSGLLPSSTTYSAALGSQWVPELGEELFTNTLTLELGQPLLRGRGSIVRAQIEAALLAADSSTARLRRLVEETIGSVETAYWTLGLAEAFEVNAGESLQRAQDLLDRDQQLADLGLLAPADVDTARAAVESRQAALVDAIRNREDAADDILFLVYGREAAARLRAQGISIATLPPAEDLAELPELAAVEDLALGSRQDVQAARHDIEQSRVSLRVADNNLLPALDAVGEYTARTENVDSFRLYQVLSASDLQFDGFTAGMVLTYSFGNNAAQAARVQAGLALERDELALAVVENAVRGEARAASRALTLGRQKLDEARQSTQIERRRYGNGLEQLRLGLIDSFRVLQYEEDVAAAELVESQALYALVNARTRYELAVGEIDDKYISGGAGVSR